MARDVLRKTTKTCRKQTRLGRRWHNSCPIRMLDLKRGRHLGIARRAAQMQVCISDSAELLADCRFERARAAAHGQSVGRQEVYEWSVVSMDGRAADASSGLDLSPTGALDKLGKVDILFVCGGINVREAVSPRAADGAAAPRRSAGAARRACAPAATRSRARVCSTISAPRSIGRTSRRCARNFRGCASTIRCSPSTATASPAPAARHP